MTGDDGVKVYGLSVIAIYGRTGFLLLRRGTTFQFGVYTCSSSSILHRRRMVPGEVFSEDPTEEQTSERWGPSVT